MTALIEKLNDLAPLIAITVLAVLFTLETIMPYLTHFAPGRRRRHAGRNLVVVVLAFACNGVCAYALTEWLGFVAAHQFGLLNWLGAAPWVAALASVVLIDLTDYPYHILTHKVPLLWRYHRVHHSDHELDSTSALRFHPLEILGQTVWQSMTLALLGASLGGYLLFGVIQLSLIFVQHANIRFPDWFERTFGWVFVTAAWHRVHHADDQRYTDSHYADVFTFWDRIFGTAPKVDERELRWGLKEFSEDRHHTVWGVLAMPFRNVPREQARDVTDHSRPNR